MSALPDLRPDGAASVFTDRLLDALKQIDDLRDLGIVSAEEVTSCLSEVVDRATAICPEPLRGEFAVQVQSLLARPRKPDALKLAQPRGELERRFALVLEQLRLRGGSIPDRDVAAAQLMILAAGIASTKDEWKQLMAQLPALPGKSVFSIMSGALASWDLDAAADDEPPAIRAMRKILSFSKESDDRAKRFRELVMAAVAKLNAGEVTAGVSMLDLAQSADEEHPLHASVINRMRTDALLHLEEGAFSRLLDDRARHPLLCRALAFFPLVAHEVLLDQLRDRKPERIELVRGLLGVWGRSVQPAILTQLESELRKHDMDRAFVVDLLKLLARLPRRAGEDDAHEIHVLGRASAPGQPMEIIGETVGTIVSLRSAAAERLLIRRLADFEGVPFRNDRGVYAAFELRELLDVIVAGLAKFQTASAIRAIVRHGIGHGMRQADARARLRFLAPINLAIDPDSVTRLCTAIRDDLPRMVLGHAVTNVSYSAPLIEALRSTRSEEAEALRIEIAANYPHLRGSIRRPAEGTPRENRTGELGRFALPLLLLSCIEDRVTGVLSLADAAQAIRAKVYFDEGKLAGVVAGHLYGLDAFYQLIEHPIMGTYALAHRAVPAGVRTGDPIDFASAFREAARRADDLQLLGAIVPADAILRATSKPPAPRRDESDPQLLRAVWLAAVSGSAVATWEATLSADSWRIRRIAVRWVEEGALEVRRSD